MSTFHVKSWRARMGWDRKQAANKLEISVHTIKSYELLQRSVPAPIEQLMKKIEAEKVVGNGSVHGAPIRIVGGGTVSHIRNHLALCAPAYGSTAKALLAICQAHDQNAEMILTRMADPSSSIETSADLENWVKSTVADHNAKIVFWNPAIVDYNGSVGNIQSGKKADRLKSREGKQNIEITPAEKLVTMFRESRKDLFLVAFKTTTNATTDEQYAAGLSLLKNASANLVLANDTVTGMNMVIVPEEARYHQTIDREVALAGLVEMTILRSKNTFTRSRVMSDIGVSWNDEAIPENLKTVFHYCFSKGL